MKSASLAQSVARQSHNLKVVSSILTGGMVFCFIVFNIFSQKICVTSPGLPILLSDEVVNAGQIIL